MKAVLRPVIQDLNGVKGSASIANAIDKLVEAFFWIDHHMKGKGWKTERTAEPIQNPFEKVAEGKKKGAGRRAAVNA